MQKPEYDIDDFTEESLMLFHEGLSWHEQGEYEVALPFFKKALAIEEDANAKPDVLALFHYYIGNSLYFCDEYKDGVTYLENSLELDDTHYLYEKYSLLMHSYLLLKHQNKILEYAPKLLDLYYKNPELNPGGIAFLEEIIANTRFDMDAQMYLTPN